MQKTTISPACFAAWQTFTLTMPIISLLAILLAFSWFTKLELVELIVLALSGGGLALIYLVTLTANSFSGLIGAPQVKWQIELVDNHIQIQTRRFQFSVNPNKLKGYTYVCDSSWDQIIGQEDSGLVLHCGFAYRILVPGSSAGFESLMELARSHPNFRVNELAKWSTFY